MDPLLTATDLPNLGIQAQTQVVPELVASATGLAVAAGHNMLD